MSEAPNNYDLDKLLCEKDIPSFSQGDTIPFPSKTIHDLWNTTLVLIDAIGGEYKPPLSTDEKNFNKRITNGMKTGLHLDHLTVIDRSRLELNVNTNISIQEGFLTQVEGEQKIGFEKIALNFLYVVLKGPKFVRFGPYDPINKTITTISNPKLSERLKAVQSLGASAGICRTTQKHLGSTAQ